MKKRQSSLLSRSRVPYRTNNRNCHSRESHHESATIASSPSSPSSSTTNNGTYSSRNNNNYNSTSNSSTNNGHHTSARPPPRPSSSASSAGASSSSSSTPSTTTTGADGRAYTPAQVTIVNKILKAKEGGRGAHYRVLEIPHNADVSAVKKAYRKLALKLHPDKNSAPHADEAFKAVGLIGVRDNQFIFSLF